MKRAGLIGALVMVTSCAQILGFEEDRLAATAGADGRAGATSSAGRDASGGVGSPAGSGGSEARSGSGGMSARAGSGGMEARGGGGMDAGGESATGGTPAPSAGRGGGAAAGSAGMPEGSGGQGEAAAAGAGGEGGTEEPCGGTAGPTPVRVGSYCIDSTEVTYAQYEEFVRAGVSPSSVVGCEWKDAFSDPRVSAGETELPVGNVDWCDAKGYCQWAGKRLCGRVGEGANPPNSDSYLNSPSLDEWYRVCSDGGTRRYTYGDMYDSTQCNSKSDGRLPVGTVPTCTAFDGRIFDLLGNTWEWVAACESTTQALPEEIRCRHRGGSYAFDNIDCLTTFTQQRQFRAFDLGFRCCSD